MALQGGVAQGNEQRASEIAREAGISNPSSGIIRFLAYNDSGYSQGDAERAGLPLTSGIIKGQREAPPPPAIASYQASKPEVTTAFENRQGELTAEKQPLIERYQSLLDTLKGKETKETALQGRTLSNEYGKRGIPLSSGMYEQDLTNKTQDISQFYSGQTKDVTLAREGDLRDLTNQVTKLTDSKVAALRDIDNRIAELQAGAGNQAATDALALYRDQLNQKFESRFDDLN